MYIYRINMKASLSEFVLDYKYVVKRKTMLASVGPLIERACYSLTTPAARTAAITVIQDK